MIDSIEEYSADQGEPGKVSGHLAKLKLMRDNILQSPSSDDGACMHPQLNYELYIYCCLCFM